MLATCAVIFGGDWLWEMPVVGAVLFISAGVLMSMRASQLSPPVQVETNGHDPSGGTGRYALAVAGQAATDELAYVVEENVQAVLELQGVAGDALEARLVELLKDLKASGTTLLIVEQNTRVALDIADYGYVMENGRIVLEGAAEELRNNEDVREFYLGLDLKGERKSYRDIKHYRRRKRWLG